MRLFRVFFTTVLLAVSACAATQAMGQAAPSAYRSPISLTVGAEASGYQSDLSYLYGIDNKLGGVGAYVDLSVWRGLGVEAEGRWLRFNEVYGINEDNYLIGPRYKFLHFWRAQPYAKGLAGFSNMNFGSDFTNGQQEKGRFTTLAFGGGLDIKVTRRWSVRAIDFEYQKYPYFGTTSIAPYGASVGVGYRIF